MRPHVRFAVEALSFLGPCGACDQRTVRPHPGVRVAIRDVGSSDMICLRCARDLGVRVLKAWDEAALFWRAGKRYNARERRWVDRCVPPRGGGRRHDRV